jgi:TPR repeat protein
MYKLLFTVFTTLTAIVSFTQGAEELNQKSKDFLSKGDTKNAVILLKKAAELGNAEAQYNFGYCYQEGIEVPKNDSIANSWLLKSAKQGWLNAQFKIAYSYAVGRGTTKDYVQAFYWALQCAKQGDPECMFNVLSCYQGGIGVAKNIDSLLVWATRLGVLENPEDLQLSVKITGARLNLAKMYRIGKQLPKDNIKSYAWFLIYNESKRDFSILEQQTQIDVIKELENNLTQTDKVNAKILAEKQLNRKLKNLDNLYKQDL